MSLILAAVSTLIAAGVAALFHQLVLAAVLGGRQWCSLWSWSPSSLALASLATTGWYRLAVGGVGDDRVGAGSSPGLSMSDGGGSGTDDRLLVLTSGLL